MIQALPAVDTCKLVPSPLSTWLCLQSGTAPLTGSTELCTSEIVLLCSAFVVLLGSASTVVTRFYGARTAFFLGVKTAEFLIGCCSEQQLEYPLSSTGKLSRPRLTCAESQTDARKPGSCHSLSWPEG
jgi:hypothetical protein